MYRLTTSEVASQIESGQTCSEHCAAAGTYYVLLVMCGVANDNIRTPFMSGALSQQAF